MPVNLVFQGGGIRGIAYAGVLEKMPADLLIKGVAGTSAGAIVAALLAIGNTPAEIHAVLREKELYELLYEDDVKRFNRIALAWTRLNPVLVEAVRSGNVSVLKLWSSRKQIRSLFSELGSTWQARGLYRSDKLGSWLSRKFEGKTFGDIQAVEDLQIVAADVSRQEYQVYKKNTHSGMQLAQAVHASASIPIFFNPFTTGTTAILVDGGILSNYPAFLFAQSKYPTIGFRLRDLIPPGPVTGTLQYLKAVLQTMTEAHDKKRPLPRHVFTYSIVTPPGIPFNKFDLKEQDMLELVHAGRQVGETVRWRDHEKQERQVSFFDPKADETLDFSVAQARELYEAYADEQSWVETLHHDAEFTVRIDRNWTVTYDRVSTMAVAGSRSLFLTRFRAAGLPQDGGGPKSLMDVHVTAQETTTDPPRDLIRIPAYNTETHKGFVMFYTPPLSRESGQRTFRNSFVIEREFIHVPDGEPASVSYGVQRLATNHVFSLRMRILADTELKPSLLFSPDFGIKARVGMDAKKIGEAFYTEHLWEITAGSINGETVYNVTVRRSKP